MTRTVLRLDALSAAVLERAPYDHAVVTGLFEPAVAQALAATFPADHYRIVSGGAEKLYRYDARPLVAFGRDEVLYAENLSPQWRTLAEELASSDYREALGRLSGLDLSDAPFEANVFQYGPRSLLEPHCDLEDKLVTHVLYFNDAWNPADGGCLRVLRSSNTDDYVKEVQPLVGSSVVLVRSDRSWHAVPAVRTGISHSRRSLTATFYRPGAKSTLFADGEDYRLMTLGTTGSGAVDRLRDFVTRAVQRVARRR